MRTTTAHRRRPAPRSSAGVLALAALVLVVAVTPGAATAQAAPAISLSRTQVAWEETTVVNGRGFRPNMAVTLWLVPGELRVGDGATDAAGTFSASARIPAGPRSSQDYYIVARGRTPDQIAVAKLTVVGPSATASVADPELAWGESTRVSGSRFAPGTTVEISLLPDTISLARAPVGTGGTFSTTITIPEGLPASPAYQVVVTGQGIDGQFAYVPSDVRILAPDATIDLGSSRVGRGGTLRVSGRSFLRSTQVTITLVPGFERLGTVRVDGNGRFATSVRIPTDAAGLDPHFVLVNGQQADGQATAAAAEVNLGDETAPRGSRRGSPPVTGPGVTLDETLDVPTAERPTTTTRRPAPPAVQPEDSSALVLISIAVLAALLIALLLLSSRKDVRRAVRRRWRALTRPVRHRLSRGAR